MPNSFSVVGASPLYRYFILSSKFGPLPRSVRKRQFSARFAVSIHSILSLVKCPCHSFFVKRLRTMLGCSSRICSNCVLLDAKPSSASIISVSSKFENIQLSHSVQLTVYDSFLIMSLVVLTLFVLVAIYILLFTMNERLAAMPQIDNVAFRTRSIFGFELEPKAKIAAQLASNTSKTNRCDGDTSRARKTPRIPRQPHATDERIEISGLFSVHER